MLYYFLSYLFIYITGVITFIYTTITVITLIYITTAIIIIPIVAIIGKPYVPAITFTLYPVVRRK